MRVGKGLSRAVSERVERTRLRLSRPDALIPLALVGLATGLVAGMVIVLFRFGVEGLQEAILPGRGPENYEALPLLQRFLLPVAGSLVIALMFRRYARDGHLLGIASVLERLAYHEGHIRLRGFLLQFVGAATAIVSGHSVGREGPHAYLGAAAGSLLGQRLELPNNSIRLLVASGVAAGIAASFNTPLAGVVFALEVLMMEYSVASFTPVIVAAVSATIVSNLALGDERAFSLPVIVQGSMGELGLVLLLGLAAGTLSAGFIEALRLLATRAAAIAIWWRVLVAGVVVGLCAMAVPGVMGIGYDTIELAFIGELGAATLAVLLVAKLVATSASIGLGIPGGMIGPALFIGAMLGGLTGLLAEVLFPGAHFSTGFYVLLGMGAVMGASLQAPLAALTAMLELTHTPLIILPGMLAVVVAGLTASEVFRKESLFVTLLRASGLDYRTHPVLQGLRRAGVASVMARRFERVSPRIAPERAQEILSRGTEWLLVDEEGRPAVAMRAIDLASHRKAAPGEGGELDLLAIPGKRLQVLPVNLQATLHEAYEILERGGAEALYVERVTAPGIRRVYGILTPEMLESAYKL